jgi:hypothetical protein
MRTLSRQPLMNGSKCSCIGQSKVDFDGFERENVSWMNLQRLCRAFRISVKAGGNHDIARSWTDIGAIFEVARCLIVH